MPRPPAPFVLHCLELLAPLGAPRSRRMFGGHGLYVDDLFIAFISDDTLYLKTDAASVAQFQQAGGHQARFETREGTIELGYWTPPDEALDAPGLLEPWARLALGAALRARARRPLRPAGSVPARRPRSPRAGA